MAAGSGPLLNTGAFVLVSMLSTTYLAHYNAPRFYNELNPPEDGSSKMPRFNLVCFGSFAIAGLIAAAVMAGGFLTFGSASQGLILNNYAVADPLAVFARLAIGVSIVFSYPLLFTGLREGVLAMVGRSEAGKKTSVHVGLSVALLAVINGIALFVKNLGLVCALGGALLGSALVYILPAVMAIGEKKGVMSKAEKVFNWGIGALGLFFAGVGAFVILK